jgi:tetratricopeptide (TPR) repeat protein
LRVKALLVGRLEQRAGTVSISMEMIDPSDSRQLWGAQYTRTASDILSIDEDISREVSDSVRLRIAGAGEARRAKRFTESTVAYELYLKGRYYWNRRTPDDLMRSVEFFKQAIVADPQYALAYAGLADAYDVLGSLGYDVLPPSEVVPKAKAAALRALELDDELAEAHAAMGFVLRFEWSRSDAGREHLRAVTLDPNYATARQWLASQFWTEGRFDEALTQLLQAQALDPLSPVITMNIGRHFYYLRDYPRSIEAFKKALVLDERNVIAGQMLALAYAAQGSTDAALAQLQRSPAPPGAWLGVGGYVSARAGELAAARRILTDLDALSAHRYIPAYAFATVYAGLGDADRAFDYLNRAADERSAYLDYANIEPTLDRLRSDSRFAQLLRRVNLPVVNIAPQTHARSAF